MGWGCRKKLFTHVPGEFVYFSQKIVRTVYIS